MTLKITLTLSDSDLQHFRRAIRDARKALEEAGEETVIKAASELVSNVRGRDVPEFIRERVEQLALFVEMVTNDLWAMPKDVRTRVLTALAYFSDPNDIIPDDVPGVGFLDDAILVELVLREFKHEIDAYRDFKAFGSFDKEGGRTGTIQEQDFRARREMLRTRIRRRDRRDRERAAQRGWKLSLW